MNRKRHNTILALSAAAVAMMLGLAAAAGSPSSEDPLAMAAQAVRSAPAPDGATAATLSPHDASIAEDALTSIGALAAAAAIRSAGAAFERGADAIEGAAIGIASERAVADGSTAEHEASGRARAKRRAIAMPYFSFAQGLRGTRS